MTDAARHGDAGTATFEEASLKRAAAAYAKSRGISAATLKAMGVSVATVWFAEIGREAPCIVFPYRRDGGVAYEKYRAFPDKAFASKKGGKPCLWNEDAVVEAETVYFVEGEFDVAALIEAGIPAEQVTTLPTGAQKPKREGEARAPEEQPGFACLLDALDRGLDRARQFVLCGDSDAAGQHQRQQLAKILGPVRCWFVDWPEGCKDANDLLRDPDNGPGKLKDLVTEGARPWPVQGLFRLSELPEQPPIEPWHPGFQEWESRLLLAPRMLSVNTGNPGSGKTHLWAQIWFNIARRYGEKIAIWTSETEPVPHYRRMLRSFFSGKLEKHMTPQEIRDADAWIEAHYLFFQEEDETPTLDWVLDLAAAAIQRHGASVIILDPWNRLEHQRNAREPETEYVGRSLTKIYAFKKALGCHFQIMAHPAKRDNAYRSEPPKLEDISGSMHWWNRVDQGFVVHRPKKFDEENRPIYDAVLYYEKRRFDALGVEGKFNIRLDPMSGRFVSTDYEAIKGMGTPG